jgi:hypothetical protein
MSYMTCPRCGLTVRIRTPYLALERCPRCIARARALVGMEFSNAPPTLAPVDRLEVRGRTSLAAPAHANGARGSIQPG